jgi:hypothetical protein
MSLNRPTTWFTMKIAQFLVKNTPTCNQVARMISDGMDRPISIRSRIAIRVHRVVCVWCDRYHTQLHGVHDATNSLHLHLEEISSEKLSEEAKERMRRLISEALK